MVRLFQNRRRANDSYQGFAKYNANYEARESYVAGLPNNGITRSQSLSNSAGSAALAALRKHTQPIQQQPQGQNQRRTNSLMTGNPRSNSMRSFIYNPPASYSVGIPAGQRRYNSLNSRSALQRPVSSENRISSLNSSLSCRLPIEEENDIDEDGDIMVTTKTTKVVDSLGRTKSITTETIKTLPDGSNIIETTTKNISRSNSRTGSLRNNSLSTSNYNSINLTKIDEDLHDFDYSYQMDNSHLSENPNKGESNLKLNTTIDNLGSPLFYSSAVPNFVHDSRSNSLDYQLSNGSQYTNGANDIRKSLAHNEPNGAASISGSSSPTRPLKSILKHKDANTSDDMEFKDAVQDLPVEQSTHPYTKLSKNKEPTGPVHNAADYKHKPVLHNDSKLSSPRSSTIIYEKLNDSPKVKHNTINDNYKEQYGSPTSSIKFREEVETIPVYREEAEKPSEADIYALAMKAAMKKVYGNRDPNTHVEQPNNDLNNATSFTKETLHNLKTQPLENSRYRYESHNKEFSLHSMRESDSVSQSTRKQRAKEERKNAKKLEKDKFKAEKMAEKMAEKAQKDAKKKKTRGFFDRMSKIPSGIESQPEAPQDSNSLGHELHNNDSPIVNKSQYMDNAVSPSEYKSNEEHSIQNHRAIVQENKLTNDKINNNSFGVNDQKSSEPTGNLNSEVCPSPNLPLDVESSKAKDLHPSTDPNSDHEEILESTILNSPEAFKPLEKSQQGEIPGVSESTGNYETTQPINVPVKDQIYDTPENFANEEVSTNEINSKSDTNEGESVEKPSNEDFKNISNTNKVEKTIIEKDDENFNEVNKEQVCDISPNEVKKVSNVDTPEYLKRDSLENSAVAPDLNCINPSSSRSLDEPIEAPVNVPIYSFDNIIPGNKNEKEARNNGGRRNSLPFGIGKKKQQENSANKKKGSFKEKFFKYFVNGYNNQ